MAKQTINLIFTQHLTSDQWRWMSNTRIAMRSVTFPSQINEGSIDESAYYHLLGNFKLRVSRTTLQVCPYGFTHSQGMPTVQNPIMRIVLHLLRGSHIFLNSANIPCTLDLRTEIRFPGEAVLPVLQELHNIWSDEIFSGYGQGLISFDRFPNLKVVTLAGPLKTSDRDQLRVVVRSMPPTVESLSCGFLDEIQVRW